MPAVIAEIHGDTVRRLRDEGHEIAAHGFKHEDVSTLGRDEERARLERTTAILAKVAGTASVGLVLPAAARATSSPAARSAPTRSIC